MSDELPTSSEDGTRATPQPEGATAAAPRAGAARKLRSGLGELLIVVIGALVISALLRAFIGQMFIIPSGSMEQTLQINDRVVVSKVTHFKRGDIVVFEDTEGWILDKPAERSALGKVGELIGVLPSTSSNHLVKRVIGMPGDHVVAKNGKVSVNGDVLDESSYVDSESGKASDFDFDVVVPKDHIFVMGDHRDNSGDSRCHLRDVMTDGQATGADAFVPTSAVVGPVVAIAMPFDRITSFSTPATFKAVPAAGTAPAVGKVSVTNPTC